MAEPMVPAKTDPWTRRHDRPLRLGLLTVLVASGCVLVYAAASDREFDILWGLGGALAVVSVTALVLLVLRRPELTSVAGSERAVRDAQPGATPFADWQLVWPLVAFVVALIGLFLLLTYVFDRFRVESGGGGNAFLPENNLPVALIVAISALLLAIAVLAIVYKRLELSNPLSPLGLPEGSVRAMIALLLIVLFFVASIFLYADSTRREHRTMVGLTARQAGAIPAEDIRVQVPNERDPARFDVTVSVDKPEASQDIAKQLVTTVSTLVVAVAAFYFGANSVQSAARAGGSEEPTPEPAPTENDTAGGSAASTPAKKAAAKKAAARKAGATVVGPRRPVPALSRRSMPPGG